MKLYLDGHDLGFAAQQMYMCLFPNTHAELVEAFPDSGDRIVSALRENGDIIAATTRIWYDNVLHEDTCEVKCPPMCDEEEKKRLQKRAIKTSLYRAALPILPKAPPWGALTGIRPSKVAAKYLEAGLSENAAIAALSRDYFVSEKRSRLAVDAAKYAATLRGATGERDASVYVGIPFCVSRCKYCSFVSHSIEHASELVKPYIETLFYELGCMGKAAKAAGLHIKSVYIGGGTPTALTAVQLGAVMKRISECFDLRGLEEYTVEAGRPDTLDADKLGVITGGGATRISLNPQTMNDAILAAMDRRHTASDVENRMKLIRSQSTLAVNTDIIAGLPSDTVESFKNTIRRVLALSPENITVHTLALKKGSTLKSENYKLPSGSETEEMVDFALNALTDAGYAPYYLYRQKYMAGNLENVGYARHGFEGRYNSYIMDELHTILSAGAGGVTKLVSHERARIERIFNPKYPYEYNTAHEKIDTACARIAAFFCD